MNCYKIPNHERNMRVAWNQVNGVQLSGLVLLNQFLPQEWFHGNEGEMPHSGRVGGIIFRRHAIRDVSNGKTNFPTAM
jgi:hypothetical protein